MAPPEESRTIGKNSVLAKKFKSVSVSLMLGLAFLISGANIVNSATIDKLLITGPDVPIEISIELVDTEEKRQTGLMNRAAMDPMSGMLFDFNTEQFVAMWMKNTLIPLDMLFVDRHGLIVFIKENAQPGDLTTIQAGQPVLAVLELVGGFAKKHRVQVGHRLVYTLFDK